VTLAELIASGRATVKLEEIVRTRAGEESVLDLSRCSAYEAVANGELPFVIRVGRRYLCSVPGLLRMLQIPLPDGWRPAGSCTERCQSSVVASDSDRSGISDLESDADRRVDVALNNHDSRRHKGSGLRAQASLVRGPGVGSGRGSPDG
jgi:hypothetical protein